jgi:hypothetical protein
MDWYGEWYRDWCEECTATENGYGEDMSLGSCKRARMTSSPNELTDGNRSNADELVDYYQLDFGVPRRRDPEQCLGDRDGDDVQEKAGYRRALRNSNHVVDWLMTRCDSTTGRSSSSSACVVLVSYPLPSTDIAQEQDRILILF